MTLVQEIIKKIEDYAPIDTAQSWDNSGWQINLGIEKTDKIMPVLDVTPDIIDKAAEKKCGLIISHHPVFFAPLKKFDSPALIKAVQNNIQIYSAHTNLDAAKGGMTDYAAAKCGFTELAMFNEFIRYKKFDKEQNFSELIKKIKTVFSVSAVPAVNADRKTYKSIAFCAGAGGEYIEELSKSGIDVYITGEIKHHQALTAGKMTAAGIGHFESEQFAAELFSLILKDIDIEIIKADEKPPMEII